MVVTQLTSGPEILIVEADFPTADLRTLFAYWTEPMLLERWWPQHAEVEPRVGGAYHLSWPQQDWHLRGRYTTFEPSERLDFTWKWDHDPFDEPERTVAIIFEHVSGATSNGTRLLLSHGPYLDTPEEQTLRLDHHLAGWLYFLPRLQAIIEPAGE